MDLEDILTCCICLDTVVAPKALPCQHTFCKQPCLQNLIQNNRVLCPICRDTFPVPVDGFPTNYIMKQLFDLKQPKNQSNEPDLTSFVIVPNQAIVAASMFADALMVAATKEGKPHWVKFNGFRIPKDAIVGGYTGHEKLYIGRASLSEAVTPGTVMPSRNSLYLAWGLHTNITKDFEVLVGEKYNWVKDSNGHVPNSALIAGYTEHGESIFIGRAMYGNKVLIGKIQPSNKLCYVPNMYEHKGKVLEFQNYEVLVEEYAPIPLEINENPNWVIYNGLNIPNDAITGGFLGHEKIYIGRAVHNDTLTPGSVIPSKKCLAIAYDSCAHIKTEFQVLVGASKHNWVDDKNGHVPDNAFVGGYTEHGERTFIGRVMHRNNLLVGKIYPPSRRCYVADFETQHELEFYEYEVLVI